MVGKGTGPWARLRAPRADSFDGRLPRVTADPVGATASLGEASVDGYRRITGGLGFGDVRKREGEDEREHGSG